MDGAGWMTTAERMKPFVSRVSFHATPVLVITECMHVFLYTTLSNYVTASVLLALLHTHIAKLYRAALLFQMIKLPIDVLALLGLFPAVFPVFYPLLFFSHVAAAKKKTNFGSLHGKKASNLLIVHVQRSHVASWCWISDYFTILEVMEKTAITYYYTCESQIRHGAANSPSLSYNTVFCLNFLVQCVLCTTVLISLVQHVLCTCKKKPI